MIDDCVTDEEVRAEMLTILRSLERRGGSHTVRVILRVAAGLVEYAAYELAQHTPSDKVAHLILLAAEMDRTADRLAA